MKLTEIEKKLKVIIEDQLGIARDQIKPESKFTHDLGADSLDTVELVMAVEEEFEFEVRMEEEEKLMSTMTFQDAVKLIEEKLNEQDLPE